MGGIFSSPTPPPPPPPTLVDTGEDERKRRIEAIERRWRGRSGTIATSERGVLSATDDAAPASKTGELKDKLGD